MEEPRWTLDELAERVDAALAVGYHGQPSGRVRDVPDRRAIRWYTTIGLIDRPVAHRGRTALYGPRHLLQLVAVKRLQARGLPLVAIQQELAGATDTDLERLARLPVTTGVVPAGSDAPAVPDVDAGPPAGPETLATLEAGTGQPAAAVPARPTGAAGVAARRLAPGPARRAAFWRDPPVAALTAAAEPTDPEVPVVPVPGVATLRGVRLAGGATLLLEPGRDLDAADLQAILDAAQPLLAVLRARQLDGPPTPAPAPRRAADGEPRREHP
jgi:DNA-binding transcriptional MerR regulator